jgi:hypothetical protein
VLACSGFVGICTLAIAVPVASDAGQLVLADTLAVLRAGLYYAVATMTWLELFRPDLYLRRFATDVNA